MRTAANALKWVKPGGSVFFRESCFHQSGNVKRSFNPTQYRHPKVCARRACVRWPSVAHVEACVGRESSLCGRCYVAHACQSSCSRGW
jgi:hypothetical protein